MAKASYVAASQAKSLSDLTLLVIALCEKSGIDVDKVLGTVEPQTRAEMKAYAIKLPAPAVPTGTPPKATAQTPAPKSNK